MLISVVLFREKKQAKIMMVILAIVTIAILITALVFYGMNQNKLNNYGSVTAIVIDYDTSDANEVWTEVQYEINGETYTKKMAGHSYWMKRDSEVEILYNPQDFSDIYVYQFLHSNITPQIYFVLSGIFGALFFVYLINFIYLCNKKS